MPDPKSEFLRLCWWFLAFPAIAALRELQYWWAGGEGYDEGCTRDGRSR